jgi:hypothetical protein
VELGVGCSVARVRGFRAFRFRVKGLGVKGFTVLRFRVGCSIARKRGIRAQRVRGFKFRMWV